MPIYSTAKSTIFRIGIQPMFNHPISPSNIWSDNYSDIIIHPLHISIEPIQNGNRIYPTIHYKNRKKKWAHSEKKDKNKCPFLKRWDLLFAKKSRICTCDANAAKPVFLMK